MRHNFKLTKTKSEITDKKKNRNIFIEDISLANVKVEMIDVSNSIKSHKKILSIKFDKDKSSELEKFQRLATLIEEVGGYNTIFSEKTDYYTVEIQLMSNSELDGNSIFQNFDKLKFNTNININLGLKRIKGEGFNKIYFSLRNAVISKDIVVENNSILLQEEDTALQTAIKIKDNISADLSENIITEQGEKAEKAKGIIGKLKQYLAGEIATFEATEVAKNEKELKETVEIKDRVMFEAKDLVELENNVIKAKQIEEQKKLQAEKEITKQPKNAEIQLDIFSQAQEKEQQKLTLNNLNVASTEDTFIDILNKHEDQFNDAIELNNFIDLDYEIRIKKHFENLHNRSLKQVLAEDKIVEMNDRIELSDFEKALKSTIERGQKLGYLSPNIHNLNDLLNYRAHIIIFVYRDLLLSGQTEFANKVGIEYLNEKNMFNDETENDTDKILVKLEILEDRNNRDREMFLAS